MVLAVLGGLVLATLAVSGLMRSCKDATALSSADRLFGGGGSSSESTAGTPPTATTGHQNGGKPAAVPRVLVKHGVRGAAKVVAIAFQLRAVPGRPAGVDRALIDALKTDDATATFFMAGLWAEAHRDVAAELAKMPHIEIGNGGYSAEYLRKMPADVVRVRTQLAQEAIRSATGVTPQIYRDAQVAYSTTSIDVIAGLGLRPVSGDIDLTRVNPKLSTVEMSQMAIVKAKPGSIIVLPGDGADPRAARAFVRILGGLKRAGFELVPVSDLAK